MGILDKLWHKQGRAGRFLYPFFYPLSLVYGFWVKQRTSLYRRGALPSYSSPVRVVSIGNISVGGSGKTPLAIYISKILSDMGYRVTVLSRGYKGSKKKRINLVSNGKEIFLSPAEAGDEPFLIASKLKGVPVITGKDRYLLTLYAQVHFNTDVVVLDDGFQHIRLRRDIDVVALTPDIFLHPYVLPLGKLREPLSSVERAHLLLIKDDEESIKMAYLKERLGANNKKIFTFKYNPVRFIGLKNGKGIGLGSIKGRKVLAVSGIANPDSFINTLKGLGVVIEGIISYPDHFIYRDKDIHDIFNRGIDSDFIITTEKDGVKLRGFKGFYGKLYDKFYMLEIDVYIKDANEFDECLKAVFQ